MDVAQWVGGVARVWTDHHPGLVVESRAEGTDPATPTLRLVLSSVVELDVAQIPGGCALEIWVESQHGEQIVLRGLTKDARCRIVRSDIGRRPQGARIILAANVQGIAEIWNPTSNLPQIVGAEDGCVGTLHVVNGPVALDPDLLPESVIVTIISGQANLLGNRRELAVRGKAVVVPNGPSQQRGTWAVEALYVEGASTLELAAGTAPRCTRVVGRGEEPTLLLEVTSSNRPWSWTVSEIADLRIETTAIQHIDELQRVERAELHGPLRLTFRSSSVGNQITSSANDFGQPSIAAGHSSVLDKLRGTLQVGVIQGAHLAGGPDGFEIADIHDHESLRSPKQGTECLAESVLTRFKLPSGLRGRQLLAQMADTYHVDPCTDDLPGWDRRWHLTPPWRLLARARSRSVAAEDAGQAAVANQPRAELRRLHHEAEFMRELQRLVTEKGAPGSTRTKVAWCAYRLRHLTTAGWVERLSLQAYRFLGYGERPMPALCTWLVTAILGAAIVLGNPLDLSFDGVRRLGRETLQQATGPLAGVMRSGAAPPDHEWEYLIRAVVAVPLVTGLLALRKYVKSRQD